MKLKIGDIVMSKPNNFLCKIVAYNQHNYIIWYIEKYAEDTPRSWEMDNYTMNSIRDSYEYNEDLLSKQGSVYYCVGKRELSQTGPLKRETI